MKRVSWSAVLAAVSISSSLSVRAWADECGVRAGRFAALEGAVEVAHAEQAEWQAASLSTVLCEGDSIRVGLNSRAAVQLVNDAVLRLDQNTTMRLIDVSDQPEERSLFELVVGAFKSFSRSPRTMTVNTPFCAP